MGVLSFDGVDDEATAAAVAGSLASTPNGAWTIAYLVKRRGTGTFDGLGYLLAAGSAKLGMTFNTSNQLVVDVGGSTVNNGSALTSTASPYIVLVSRPAGTDQPLTYRWKLGSGGAWSSASPASGIDNDAATVTALELGKWENGDPAHMFLGLFGVWNRELTQAQAESLDDNWRTSDWWNVGGGSPVCLVECNTATLVDLAGNATSWSVSGGLAVDGAETLDSWNFDGTGGPALTYPSAVPDWQRNAFPFILGDRHIQGVSRASTGARRLGRRMGPSPIGGFERYIFPRLHPDFGATGITYDKLGDLIAGALSAAEDAFEASETGSLTPDTFAAAADVFEAAETGSLTPDTSVSGADVFEHSETGALVAGVLVGGADVYTAAKAGSLTTAAFLAGVGSKAAEKAGSLVVGVFTAGADAFTAAETGTISTAARPFGADVFEHNETGSLSPAAQLRGADIYTAAKTGSLTAGTFIAGADVSTFNRTGSLTTRALPSGVAVKVGSYLKTGSLTVGVALSGADQSTLSRAGSLITAGFLSGGKLREKTKSGSLTTAVRTAGADTFTAVRSGTLSPTVRVSGPDSFTATRLGSLTAGTFLAGVAVYIPAIGPAVQFQYGVVTIGPRRAHAATVGRISTPDAALIER